MNCSQCNASIPDGARFCPECGASGGRAAINCTHCGESQPLGSRFCVQCGQSMSAATLVQTTTALRGATMPFIRLLSEDTLRSLSNVRIENPYGCAAVLVVDGLVHEVRTQPSVESNDGSAIADFLRGVSVGMRALFGQRPMKVKTYLVSDYRNLPFVSFVHKLRQAGASTARVQVSFWIDFGKDAPESLNRFLRTVVGDRESLSVQEFRDAAINALTPILAQFTDRDLATTDTQRDVMDHLRRQYGISGAIRYSKGLAVGQRNLEVGQFLVPVMCHSCGTECLQKSKFCELCGASLSNADWAGATRSLAAVGGEALVLKLTVVGELIGGNVAPQWTDQRIRELVYVSLDPVLRKRPLDSLMTGSVLAEINQILALDVHRNFQGGVAELQVTDVRTGEQDWFFKTDLLVADELRKIETDRRLLAVDDSELDYKEAAFAISIRRLQQSDSHELQERRARLVTASASAGLEAEEHQLRTSSELGIEAIDHAAEQERFARARQDLLRDRGLERELQGLDRAGALEQLSHEQSVERSAAGHDAELSDMVGDARSRARRRDIGDNSFEAEEALRLRSAEKEKLGHIEEDLQDRQHSRQVDKLRAMADLEAQMARLDQDFELQKIEGMRGMDAKQILALQAAQLAKAAGTDGAASVVQSIAQSHADAASSDLKEAMYRQMFEIQEKAAEKAAQAQKDAMEAMLRTNADLAKMNASVSTGAAEGYKEAAKIAQSTNEKSMESMAKVATATAGRKSSRDETPETRNTFQCSSCEHSYEGRKKFCPQCGASQE